MKVLAVTMSVRDFLPCQYWNEQVDEVDKILYKNFWHMEAHELSKKFFLEHDYTHYLFLAEDIIVPPEYVKLIIRDAEEKGFPVVAGYSNVDFIDGGHANISFTDLRKTRVYYRQQYNHPLIKDVFLGKYGFPFVNVTFQGNGLTLIERSVVERLSFRPYAYRMDYDSRRRFKCNKPFGIMHDLQMCLEMLNMNVPIVIDARLFCPHFAFGADVISLEGKSRYIKFFDSKNRVWTTLDELPPYG